MEQKKKESVKTFLESSGESGREIPGVYRRKRKARKMKKLGVIGGLGPMATVYFLQLITQMSDARTDQEHMEIILHSKPRIPDRTRFIIGESTENPMPRMVEVGEGLVRQGAEILAIPCITAHYFQRELEAQIGIPVLNAIEETALYLQEAGISRAGILATDGTIESNLFRRALEERQISCITPSGRGQKHVMHLIYENVKAGLPVEMDRFRKVSEELREEGAQVILLACTELSLIKRDYSLGEGYLDVLDVLARKAVGACGHLKKEYDCLITGQE